MSSLVKQQEDVYLNFVNSIKSDVTRKIYEYNLRLFMEFCGINKFEDLIERQNQIIAYLMSLRERKLSYNSISTRLNAIYHFYDMNDVSLNKKKIKMFKGEYSRKVVDRAYIHEDIKKILDVSDLRAKTIVLLMASSGIRIGGLPDIRIRNLEKVNNNNIYKITVYEGSNSQYFTFCTPECTSYIDAYLDFRTKNGENLNKDSYIIRDQFDITDLEQIRNKSKGMSIGGIESLLSVILLKSGVRAINHNRDSKDRFFAFVDFNENEGTVRECPHCLEYEIHNKLKPRILKKGEVKPPDYDDFVQCWECGNIFPIYQSYPESEIKDSLETVKTPFENSESIFLSTDSSASQRRKRERKDGYRKGVHKYTSKRFADKDHEDPEIQAGLDKGNVVNIL